MTDADDLTRFLNDLSEGAQPDSTRLMPVVYGELKNIAEAFARAENPANTLQATALVSEAFVRLFDEKSVKWNGRKHFYAVAAKAMRNLLVDQARRRKRRGRTKEDAPPTLDQAIADANGMTLDMIDLDAALSELQELDEDQAKLVELKYFVGLEVAEIARVLSVSVSTVEREWRAARAWLAKRLGEPR